MRLNVWSSHSASIFNNILARQELLTTLCYLISSIVTHSKLPNILLFYLKGTILTRGILKTLVLVAWTVVSQFNQALICNFLPTSGADVSLQNDKGSSPLYFAVRYGYTDMVKVLIREGNADVHQKRKLGLISPIGKLFSVDIRDGLFCCPLTLTEQCSEISK